MKVAAGTLPSLYKMIWQKMNSDDFHRDFHLHYSPPAWRTLPIIGQYLPNLSVTSPKMNTKLQVVLK